MNAGQVGNSGCLSVVAVRIRGGSESIAYELFVGELCTYLLNSDQSMVVHEIKEPPVDGERRHVYIILEYDRREFIPELFVSKPKLKTAELFNDFVGERQ